MSLPESRGGELVPFPGVEVAPAAEPSTELVETILEGELIPAEEETLPAPRRELPPIVAPWLRSREDVLDRARRLAKLKAHMAAHHTVHTPLYAARLARNAPTGAAKVAGGLWRWGTLADQAALRDAAIQAGHTGHAAALVKYLDDQRRKVRARLATLGAGAGAAGLAVHQAAQDPATALAAGAAVLAALGIAGRRRDRPVVDRYDPPGRAISASIVVEALTAAGIFAGTPTNRSECRVLLDPARDGKGYSVPVALPIGRKTVADVEGQRLAIAANLGVHEDQLFVERTPGQEAGRFRLWISDTDPYAEKPPVSPLVTAGRVNFFEPCPFGVTGRGDPVSFTMRETHMLVGSKTGMGKTFAARIVGAWAALDPDVQLWVFDGKGGADWEPFRLVSHRHVASADTESCHAVRRALEEVERERVRRGEQLKKLAASAPGLVPEGKHTEKLARLRKGGMPLLLVVLDEVQEFISDEVHGKAIAESINRIAKLGRSAGIILLVATQRPDKTVIPPGLVAQLGIRLALKVMDQPAAKLVTGVDDYAYSSHTFAESHKGVGWLIGLGEPQRVRAHFLATDHVRIICERARALREAAGKLTGQAAGIEDPATPEVLDDVLGVLGDHEDRLWTSAILARLAEAHPERYGPTFGSRELGKALREAGVAEKAKDLHGTGPDGAGKTERGYLRAWLMAALAAHGAPNAARSLPASERNSNAAPEGDR